MEKLEKNRKNKRKIKAEDFNPFLLEDDIGFMLYKLEMNNEFLEYYRSMVACLTDEEKELLRETKKQTYI